MIRLDKIKIIAPITAIRGYENNSCFEETSKDNEIRRYKFSTNRPFLHVIVTPSEFKVSVEFSGKILGERYPELISKDTFTTCLDRINNMGLFNLNAAQILMEGVVGQCDITADIEVIDADKLSHFLLSHIASPKWTVETYGGGIVIRKTVKTTKYQRRLTIYNKEAEMQKQSNLDFLSQLDNSQAVVDYFKNKTRLELNLNSMQAIRDALGIESNSIRSVLQAECNPIRDVVHSSVKLSTDEKEVKSLRDFERCAVLEKYNFDLSLIRANISRFFSNPNSVNKALAVYRNLAQALRPADFGWLDSLRDQVA